MLPYRSLRLPQTKYTFWLLPRDPGGDQILANQVHIMPPLVVRVDGTFAAFAVLPACCRVLFSSGFVPSRRLAALAQIYIQEAAVRHALRAPEKSIVHLASHQYSGRTTRAIFLGASILGAAGCKVFTKSKFPSTRNSLNLTAFPETHFFPLLNVASSRRACSEGPSSRGSSGVGNLEKPE